jgi:hypothetical protein
MVLEAVPGLPKKTLEAGKARPMIEAHLTVSRVSEGEFGSFEKPPGPGKTVVNPRQRPGERAGRRRSLRSSTGSSEALPYEAAGKPYSKR